MQKIRLRIREDLRKACNINLLLSKIVVTMMQSEEKWKAKNEGVSLMQQN